MFPRMLIWLMGCSCLFAQPSAYRFQRLGVGEGLSMASVTSLAQDNSGLMWMATQNGANVYNGYQIKQFFHETGDATSLRDNFVREVCVDSAGRIWLATLSGLDRYDPKTRRFIHYAMDKGPFVGASSEAITVLHCNGKGGFWVGTLDRGVFRYEPETDTFVRVETELKAVERKHPIVTALGTDLKGQLWVCGIRTRVLISPDGRQMAKVQDQINAKLPEAVIKDMVFFDDGGVMLGFERAGVVYLLPDGSVQHYQHKPGDLNGLPDNDVLDLHVSSNGVIWVGTANGLARMRRNGTARNYFYDPQNSSSLADNRVFQLYEDRGGVMWVATNNGVSRMKVTNEVFERYQQGPEAGALSHNRIKSLFDDGRGSLWIGTFGGGLNRLDLEKQTVSHFRHDPNDTTSLSSDNVFAMAQLGDAFFVGTYGGGLNRFNPTTATFERVETDLAEPMDGRILCLYAEGESRLWVGTWSGLYLYDVATGKVQRIGEDIAQDFNLKNTTVRKVLRDSQGRLWVASFGNGLYAYDHEKRVVKNWRHREGDASSLSQDRILTVVEDRQNRLWVGTLGGGLNRFFPETGSFRRVPLAEAQADRVIVGLLTDAEGVLWMSTYAGILRFDPQDETYVRYALSDGLQGLEFNSGAYTKLADGRLAFGGTQGVNIFDPGLLQGASYQPPVMLTGVRVFNREIDFESLLAAGKPVELDYGSKVLSFEYAALDYADPDGVRYAYMLEQFDQTWQQAGNRRHVTYTNLAPGDYRLRVKAASAEGVWNEAGVTLPLRVIPPVYMRTWFYLLIGFLVLAVIRYWTWQHRRQKLMLQNRVDERTRDLRESNLRLADTIRELEETAGELRKTQATVAEAAHRAGMAEIATDVLHAIGNSMNSLQVSTEQVHKVVQELPGDFLVNIAELLEQNQDQLGPFFETTRGQRLAGTLRSLGELLAQKGDLALDEVRKINERCFQISGILNSQRQYAFDDDYLEDVDLRHLVDDVLRFQSATLSESNIQVNRHYEHVPHILVSKSRVMHILNHLIRNACDALKEGKKRDERLLNLWIRHHARLGKVMLEIRDNGKGIRAEDLEQIFTQGYTTKKGASGYGLHYCMLTLVNMGGKIRVESSGLGHGASFFVELPSQQIPKKAADDPVSISV